MLTLATALGGAAALPAQAATPQPQMLDFKGADLGMSLQAWKALPFPGRTNVAASPICTDDPSSARLDLAISASEKQAGVIGCTYVFGPADGAGPRHPVPLDDRLSADHVLYKFRGGRLVSISYRTTVDAFDDIVARLTAEAGTPASVQRDQVSTALGTGMPRVRMSWRTPSGTAVLTDPSNQLNRLSVTLTTAAPNAAGAKT
ncbi:MAG: hypothetical protein WA840_07275 [Caulobacteraceae bacterium]